MVKMLFQGWMGRGLRMIHVRKSVKLGLGREEKFGRFGLGKKTEKWNSLSKVTEEAGRHQTSGFPPSIGLESGFMRREQCGDTRKEGSSLSDSMGGLAHR